MKNDPVERGHLKIQESGLRVRREDSQVETGVYKEQGRATFSRGGGGRKAEYACAQVRGSGGGDVSGSSAVIFSVKDGSHQLAMRSGVVTLEVS